MSVHPTTTSAEIEFVCESIRLLSENHQEWAKEYQYNPKTNEFNHKVAASIEKERVADWFKV
jgi:hypothetical protein